jgi:molybdopterin-guanine dinucleotide biosynthesis protein A
MNAEMPSLRFAAALIAGGQSSRMGRDKAWLDWRGEALWQHQLGKLMELDPAKLLLSCREEQKLHSGPLPALARCLDHAQLPVLALAVDMPHVTVALLRELLDLSIGTTFGVVFHGADGYEPLCALYPPAALPLLRGSLARGNLRMQAFVQDAVDAGLLRVIPLSKGREAHFISLNTPADLA